MIFMHDFQPPPEATVIASCNAINYCNARPIFVDVDRDTMGLSPSALSSFLEKNTKIKNKMCINKKTKNRDSKNGYRKKCITRSKIFEIYKT